MFYRSIPEAPATDGNKIGGYAALFGETVTIRENGRTFRERIARGAFRRALADNDVFALFNHNRDHVLGRVRAGTLRLGEDRRGLAWEADLPDTSYAADLRTLIERGEVTQCSFGFTPNTKDEWKGDLRTLTDIDMFDVSAVSVLAGYPSTTVELRATDATDPLTVHRLRARAWGALIGR
jgi:Escherichia/Staphylococcus phage prohead protease